MSAPELYGLVLAGGHSMRMGQDKSSLIYRDRPQVDVTFDLVLRVCARAFLSNRADQRDATGHSGKPQLHDRYENLGPMGGLLTAFDEHPDKAWLVVACDLPFLDRTTLDDLIAHRDPKREATAFYGQRDGLPEPLCAIYEPAMRARLQQALKDGKTCPRKALIRSDARLLHLPHAHALENANSPIDFGMARDAIASGRTVDLTPPVSAVAKQHTVHVRVYAILRERLNQSELMLETSATTARELYGELSQQFSLPWPAESFRVAINDAFCDWNQAIHPGDRVAIIPPVAGG